MSEWFCGPQWRTERDKLELESRLMDSALVTPEIERLSVLGGERLSTLQIITNEELPKLQRWVESVGLRLTILAAEPLPRGSAVLIPTDGPLGLRVAVHSSAVSSEDWRGAYSSEDSEEIGKLLSYPECCREFFKETFDKGMIDPTSRMVNSKTRLVECNTLLRWIGVRLVSHLPCSFDCQKTKELARSFKGCARTRGLHEEVDFIHQMLGVEVRWSGKNEIGIVATPAFRFSFSTSPLDDEVNIFLEGSNQVPYFGPPSWADNGFKSRQAMEHAHGVLANHISLKLGESFIDLGCGDGTLIEKLSKSVLVGGIGVDSDEGRIERGKVRNSGHFLTHSTITQYVRQHPNAQFDCTVFMPGRLLELPNDEAELIRDFLLKNCKRLYLYGYSDNIKGNFEIEARKAGFSGLVRLGGDRKSVEVWKVIK